MGTNIRPEIAKCNKYYISKHRYYELKHFCLQYDEWQRAYNEIEECIVTANQVDKLPGTDISDRTAKLGMKLYALDSKMRLVRRCAQEADPFIGDYIFDAVTNGRAYPYYQGRYDLPCSRDTFFDRYRKFFWLLSKERD